MKDLVRLFQRAANADRLRILNLLAHSNLCGHDIEAILGLPQPSVSRHLALLRGAKLVRFRRDGLRVRYFLARSHVFSYPFTNFLYRLLPFMPEFERDLQKLEEFWDQGRLRYKPWLDPLVGEPITPDQITARGGRGLRAGPSPGSTSAPRSEGGRA
ncbi:MAG: metalloregulator ArsR/SmtB family transcription factor [Acidobacteriia bacterium]|nr:metalloregulator ArsR/SmtB family transcription factor [Terriglobia bacterium]